jgi:hypothetical protein
MTVEGEPVNRPPWPSEVLHLTTLVEKLRTVEIEKYTSIPPVSPCVFETPPGDQFGQRLSVSSVAE